VHTEMQSEPQTPIWRLLGRTEQWSQPVGGLRSPSVTIWARSYPGWVIFQSVESPNSRPPPGQPETDRPNSDTPPAVRFASRIPRS
jgi:hypothetical protein